MGVSQNGGDIANGIFGCARRLNTLARWAAQRTVQLVEHLGPWIGVGGHKQIADLGLEASRKEVAHALVNLAVLQSSRIGLLRWFWSALCGHKKASISFRPHRVVMRHSRNWN